MSALASPPGGSLPAAVVEAEALHARVRAQIAAFRARLRSGSVTEPSSELPFEELARQLPRFQARHIPGYARLCAARGVDPESASPGELPAVPTDAFRLARVASFPPELEVTVFRTSGTTVGARGAHAMRTLTTYRDAAMAAAAATLFAPFRDRVRILALAPSAAEAPDSSLSRMLEWFISERGDAGSTFLRPDDPAAAVAAMERAALDGPLLVLGTAFAHVHLLDHLADKLGGRSLPLPNGSRVMQTGGFKGRSREVPPEQLRAMLAAAFELPRAEIVGEYGMTELTSQLWATPESGSDDRRWMYRAPPWVRVVACDPATLAPLPNGARGIARIEDLGNVESAWAVQTADEVMVHVDQGAGAPAGCTVEILGRLPGASPRGCSLAVEELLGDEAR